MRLVKGDKVFISDNENYISAYKENGYVEEKETHKEESPKKTTTKKSK